MVSAHRGNALFIICVSEVPAAGDLREVGASLCAEVYDSVVAAVDVGKVLVERHIEHIELVVVADEPAQECLVGEGERRKGVVGAVDVFEVGAVLHG